MQIKQQLGKLKLNLPLAEIIASQQRRNGIEILPVSLAHVLEVDDLPGHHKDPFDRLLVAPANVEQAVLISNDPIFSRYVVNVV
jgi:PIN domain nuclease of toxin-antitoxin system